MIGAPIAVRRPANIDNAVDQRQSRALVFFLGIESQHSADVAVTGARIGRGNHHRAIRALQTGGNVERPQTLHVGAAIFFGSHHDVKSARGGVNYRGTDDAHIAMKILIIAAARAGHVGVARRHDIETQKIGLPIGSGD